MRPLFKYSGGKARELKFLNSLVDLSEVSRCVEPFAGSAAFSLSQKQPCLLGDADADPINVFQVLASDRAEELHERLVEASELPVPTKEHTKAELAEFDNLYSWYYRQRDEKFGVEDPVDKAFRFVFLRQLCFSGMTRVNAKTGKSNVPFGWYGSFNPGLLRQWDEAVKQAKSIEAHVQSWDTTLDAVRPDDFVFLDPPYLNRAGYTEAGFDTDVELHTSLAETLRGLDAPWLLVHCDCPEYREMYAWASITEKPFTYSQNFKGRDNSKARVSHLYIQP